MQMGYYLFTNEYRLEAKTRDPFAPKYTQATTWGKSQAYNGSNEVERPQKRGLSQ